MIYCHHCGKKVKEGTTVCPECHEEITIDLNDDEVRPLIQKIHKKRNIYRERISTGLSAVVIGAILLIIGWIFFYLAFKLDQANTGSTVYYLKTTSAEFWVFIVGVVAGGILLIAGATISITYAILRKMALNDTEVIRATKKASTVPLDEEDPK